MKDPYEVLRLKEQALLQVRRETEALRIVIGLLDEDAHEEADALQADTPSRSAVFLASGDD